MKTALKQETYRVFHSIPLLVLLAASLILGFLYGSVQPMFTDAQFENVMEARYGIQHIGAAKRVLDLEDSRAETWGELYRDFLPQNYFRFMPVFISLFPAALVLTIFQLSSGRERGTVRSCGLLGGSVRKVILARLTVYYLLAMAILLPILLLQTAVYTGGLAARYGSGVMLRNGALRILMDLSVLSIYAWLGVFIRRKGLRIALLILLTPVFWLVNLMGAWGISPDYPLFIPFPPFLHGQAYLFLPEAGAGWIILAALASLAWIFLLGRACVKRWEKELGLGASERTGVTDCHVQ